MSNITYKTAKQLQEAGFPRPDRLQRGQAWYNEKRKIIWINDTKATGYFPGEDWVYAPGLEEILQQAPGYEINYMGTKWEVCGLDDTFYGDEATETAALAFFHYRKEEKQLEAVKQYRKLEKDQKADQN